MELLPGYVLLSAWGVIVGAAHLRDVVSSAALSAFAINTLLFAAWTTLNAVVDVETDLANDDKRFVATSVILLGRRTVLTFTAGETAVAVGLLVGLAARLGQPLLVGIAAIWLAGCLMYNVEPVHLKRRGLLNPICYGVALALPSVLLGFVATRSSETPPGAWLLLGGLVLYVTGACFWWTGADAPADSAAGLATPGVRYGVLQTLWVGWGLIAIAWCLIGWGLASRYGPGWAVVGIAGGLCFLLMTIPLLLKAVVRAKHPGKDVETSVLGYRTPFWWLPYWLIIPTYALLMLVPLVHL